MSQTPNLKQENIQSHTIKVSNKNRTYLLKSPTHPTLRPCLLIILAMGKDKTLTKKGLRRIPDCFSAAGHYVASFDLPNHGDLINHYGQSLSGMANAISEGVDVFEEIRDTATLMINDIMKKCNHNIHAIVTSGTSRGGLAALHTMSSDRRINAAAICCPVTYLPALEEFSEIAQNKIIKKSNAEALIPKLKDRPIFITMAEKDKRVDANACFQFFAKLKAKCKKTYPEISIGPGESHGKSYQSEAGQQEATAFLLNICSELTKQTVTHSQSKIPFFYP